LSQGWHSTPPTWRYPPGSKAVPDLSRLLTGRIPPIVDSLHAEARAQFALARL
jgi:hypothetical protein